MNSKHMICPGTAALAALVALALAAPVMADSLPTDAWITAKVKIALATTEGSRAAGINVDTVDRQVTLHGTVTTAAEKEKAGATARNVRGAHSMRNLLQVVPAETADAVEEKDDETRARVAAALAAEPSLGDSKISVQSVNKGVVLLQGHATNLSDYLTAVDVTTQTKGVRRVASEIESGDSLASDDVWMERNIPVATGAAEGVRSTANDLYITSKVKMALLANAETPAMDINVDTRVGIVTLFGMVPTAESKAAAEAEAAKTGGVVAVRNQLQVMPSAKQPAVEAKDDITQIAVKKNLGRHVSLGNVTSEVSHCIVRLTGTVPSGADRVEAMQIARATKGVCSVRQDLVIR